MRRNGIKKVDDLVDEEGKKHAIRLNMATGVFSCSIDEASNYQSTIRFDGTLEEVRSKATRWLKGLRESNRVS